MKKSFAAQIPASVLAILSLLGFAAGWIVTRFQAAMKDFHIDMEVYRAGGRAILDNTPLYDHWFQAGNIQLPFTYPPFGALILTPLSMFDFMDSQDSSVAMIYFSSLLMLLCLFLVARTLLGTLIDAPNALGFTLATAIWPLAMLTEPLWKNAVYTQVNVLIMTLILLDLLPRKRRIPQGWLIGIAAAIKLTPAVMLLVFLVRKDWRSIITAAVSAVGATALTPAVMLLVFLVRKDWRSIITAAASAVGATAFAALIRPKDTWAYFTSVLYDVNRIGDVGYATNGSFKGAITRFWPSKQAALEAGTLINILWLACSLVAIAAAYVAIRALLQRGLLVDAVMVNAALMLLISPISWSHHWVWMPLWALVLVWRWWHTNDRPVVLLVGAVVLAALTLYTPPHWWFGDYFGVEYTFAVWKKFLVMDFTWYAMFFIGVVWWAARQVPAPTSANEG